MSYTDPVKSVRSDPDINLPWLSGVRGLSIESDISGRPSKCRKCKLTIPTRSPRMAMVFQHSYKNFMSGGGCKETKMYFHEACLAMMADEKDTRTCSNCHGPMPHSVHRNNLGWCIKCMMTPLIGSCHYCDQHVDRSQLSEVVTVPEEDYDEWSYDRPDIGHPYYCCRECERHMKIPTQRTVLRRERKERAMINQVKAVVRDIESWDYD